MYRGDYKKGEIEILQENLVYENCYMQVYNDNVIFPSGVLGTYIRLDNRSKGSVAVLPITDDGQIILIRNFRHGQRGWCYELPKGGLSEDESDEEGARRELLEETGILANTLIDFGSYSDSPAIQMGQLHCFIAPGCLPGNTNGQEVSEAISNIIVLSPKEYLFRNDGQDFRDALTELLVMKYLYTYNNGEAVYGE